MGGQSGCELRIEVFVKIQKKKFEGGGVGGGWGCRGRGQGGCERRIAVFVKIQKKIFLGWGRGVSGRGRVGGGGGQGGCERN